MNKWELASNWGIQMSGTSADDPAAVWNAGHVNDILTLPTGLPGNPDLLVASETGGVWIISAYVAMPLSDSWNSPNMASLAKGPDGNNHYYAAGGDNYCLGTNALYVTDAKNGEFDITKWSQIKIADESGKVLDSSPIMQIAVLDNLRKLVLACRTSVFWSDIPSPGGKYAFTQADIPGGDNNGFNSIALGPDNSLAVGSWVKSFSSTDRSPDRGIFYGSFSTNAAGKESLNFTKATIHDVDEQSMVHIKLNSCAGDRNIMYATSPGLDDHIYTVIKSTDGGKNWAACGAAIKTSPSQLLFGGPQNPNVGHSQHGYNICIGISPFDSNHVMFGYSLNPFYSLDGGLTWNEFMADVHHDKHVIYFDPLDAETKSRVYFGTDGGVFMSNDFGKTMDSRFNRLFPNLQIQYYPWQVKCLSTFSDSPGIDNLAVASLQDNGTICAVLDGTYPWKQLEGGDGSACLLVGIRCLLRYNNTLTTSSTPPIEYGIKVRISQWNDSARKFDILHLFPASPVLNEYGVIPVDGTEDGLSKPYMVVVRASQYRKKNELLYAIAGANDTVYGLFSDSVQNTWHWIPFSQTIPVKTNSSGKVEFISAVGSTDGLDIYIGTSFGRIFHLAHNDQGNWTLYDISRPAYDHQINAFIVQPAAYVFAIAKGILKYDGSDWEILPFQASTIFQAIEVDYTTFPQTLYLASDEAVFQSIDNGESWTPFTDGLPKVPHCANLSFVQQSDGSNYLYLATYGRSIYKISLSPEETQQRPALLAGRVGDMDGDGTDEILVTSDWGIGILKKKGDSMTSLAVAANGLLPGGWHLDTADNQFGPVADFDNDGYDEIFVTSSWGVALLKLEGGKLVSLSLTSNGTEIGINNPNGEDVVITLNTGVDKFGPVFDQGDGTGAALIYANATGVGAVGFPWSGPGPADYPCHLVSNFYTYGTNLYGGWTLSKTDVFGPVGDFDATGGRDEVLVIGGSGIAMLSLATGNWAAINTAKNGTELQGGWLLDSKTNKFFVAGVYLTVATSETEPWLDSPALDVLLVTSPWGIGALWLGWPNGVPGPIVNYINPTQSLVTAWMTSNGTTFNGWKLNTADSVFGPTGLFFLFPEDKPASHEIYAGPNFVFVMSNLGICIFTNYLTYEESLASPEATAPFPVTALAIEKNDSILKGWVLDVTTNHFGAPGNYEGGMKSQIFVTSPSAIAILKPSGNKMEVVMMQLNGALLGEWRLNTATDTF